METLEQIAKENPNLIFQNSGYQYIPKSKLSESDLKAIEEINVIMKKLVKGFVKFFNFRYDNHGELDIRVDYHYDSSFIGVGYFAVKEADTELKALSK